VIQFQPVEAAHGHVVREMTDAILTRIGRTIDDLSIDCDGEVVTVRGKVPTYYLWQQAFSAACHASRRLGSLLLDYQVQATPPETAP